eukprot:2856375-Prymnesium_polylepis.3
MNNGDARHLYSEDTGGETCCDYCVNWDRLQARLCARPIDSAQSCLCGSNRKYVFGASQQYVRADRSKSSEAGLRRAEAVERALAWLREQGESGAGRWGRRSADQLYLLTGIAVRAVNTVSGCEDDGSEPAGEKGGREGAQGDSTGDAGEADG